MPGSSLGLICPFFTDGIFCRSWSNGSAPHSCVIHSTACRSEVDRFDGAGNSAHCGRVDTQDVDAADQVGDDSCTEDIFSRCNGRDQFASYLVGQAYVRGREGIFDKIQSQLIDIEAGSLGFGQGTPGPMCVRRHSSRHLLRYRRSILLIEVAVVTFQHDLYALAAGILKQTHLFHYVSDPALIYVIAGHGGHIGRCTQATEKLKQWLICPLTSDIPQRDIDQAEASLADGFAKHTCVGFHAEEDIVPCSYFDRT